MKYTYKTAAAATLTSKTCTIEPSIVTPLPSSAKLLAGCSVRNHSAAR